MNTILIFQQVLDLVRRFSQETIPSDVNRSLFANSQQATSVQSESETPIYNNVNKIDTTSSEQHYSFIQLNN